MSCAQSIPVLRPIRLKNHTLWGGTWLHVYSLYRGILSHPGFIDGVFTITDISKSFSYFKAGKRSCWFSPPSIYKHHPRNSRIQVIRQLPGVSRNVVSFGHEILFPVREFGYYIRLCLVPRRRCERENSERGDWWLELIKVSVTKHDEFRCTTWSQSLSLVADRAPGALLIREFARDVTPAIFVSSRRSREATRSL